MRLHYCYCMSKGGRLLKKVGSPMKPTRFQRYAIVRELRFQRYECPNCNATYVDGIHIEDIHATVLHP